MIGSAHRGLWVHSRRSRHLRRSVRYHRAWCESSIHSSVCLRLCASIAWVRGRRRVRRRRWWRSCWERVVWLHIRVVCHDESLCGTIPGFARLSRSGVCVCVDCRPGRREGWMRRRFQGFVTRKVKPREVGDVRRVFAQQDRWGARRSGRWVDERLVSVSLVDPDVVVNAALVVQQQR